jgi:hypothetical protein
MKAQIRDAGLVSLALAAIALACEKGNAPSGPTASKFDGSAAQFSRSTSEGDGANESNQRVRWDIVNIDASGNVTAGGQNSAQANDGSTLTLTGSGTFPPGNPDDVTGGGTWTLGTSSGTYQVTRLVRFTPAPGTFTFPSLTDQISNPADARAGLAVLEVEYSDQGRGVLVFSCSLKGTPLAVFEGSTASKGFVDFWNRTPHNATIFHVLHESED